MKMFIPLMCLVSLALAEPPVGDGYPAARSSHDDHHHDHHASDHQRSLSQEYGPPSDFASARKAPSNGYEYNAPSSRSFGNGRGQSQFPPATVRVSFNQRFGSAAVRSSDHNSPDARGYAQEYAGPNARSGVSPEYGAPAARSLSQEYGVPSVVAARSLSSEYGAPNARSSPSEEYGAPSIVAARSNHQSHSPASNFRSAQPARGSSQDFSGPAARSQFQADSSFNQGFDSPRPFSKSAFASRSAPSSSYGTPSSRSLSASYGAPSSRSSESYSEDYNQSGLSETYGAPSARSLSQEYGAPSSQSSLRTIASTYAAPSSRSTPSSTYLPASRSAAPSEQHGVPEQRDGASQGYDYAKARALEELLSQEPANYDFAYQIEDYESGSDFGHAETRQADRAEGSYFVVLPDGTKQTVEYEADEGGFKPRISVEPADASARSGGYDENAAEIAVARSADGPY